jgi:hypothetical protein
LDAEHAAPPSPARRTRLRAVLTTATQVCADQSLKADLTAVLGKDGFRYVRRTSNS